MSIADIIVIYLAVGAPLAVYQYFRNRRIGKSRRLLSPALALIFWPAIAARLAGRHLTNAYSDNHFVSNGHLDVSAEKAGEMRKRLGVEMVGARPDLSAYDLRDVLDRYVGLSILANEATSPTHGPSATLFRAAGHQTYELGVVCLMRRNRRRLLAHHNAACYEFLNFFERLSKNHPKRDHYLKLGIDLARELKDDKTVALLETLASRERNGRKTQDHTAVGANTIGSPLRMEAISPSSD